MIPGQAVPLKTRFRQLGAQCKSARTSSQSREKPQQSDLPPPWCPREPRPRCCGLPGAACGKASELLLGGGDGDDGPKGFWESFAAWAERGGRRLLGGRRGKSRSRPDLSHRHLPRDHLAPGHHQAGLQGGPRRGPDRGRHGHPAVHVLRVHRRPRARLRPLRERRRRARGRPPRRASRAAQAHTHTHRKHRPR